MSATPIYLAVICYIFIILEYYSNITKSLWIMRQMMWHIWWYVQIFLHLHSYEVCHPKLTRVARKCWITSGIHLLGWWCTWADPHPAINWQWSLSNYQKLWGWINHNNRGRWMHLEPPSVGSEPRNVIRTPNSSHFVRQLYVSVVLVKFNQVW